MPRLLLIVLTSLYLTNAQQVLTSLYLTSAHQLFKTVLDNLKGDLTPNCQQQIVDFSSNLSLHENSWAMKMVDASSKLPNGIFSFNLDEMGNFDQCVEIKVETDNSGEILGKYCLGRVAFGSDISTLTDNPKSVNFLNPSSQKPVWGLCLPSGCSTKDANRIGNGLLEAVLPHVGLRLNISDPYCQTMKEVDPELTTGAVCIIAIFTFIGLIVLMCSFYDIYFAFYGDDSCPFILKGFSLYSNSLNIFKIATYDKLPCLHGLRFYSMMWVVIGHQFSIAKLGSMTNTKNAMDWADHLYSMFIVSGTLSVDTFLTIGGTLMAYKLMKTASEEKHLNAKLCYSLFHRYLRLTTPLFIVVLFSATLLKYTGSGPKWPAIIVGFQNNCEDHYMSTLFYFQNLWNVSEMCVGQTWYLNIDMQLYFCSLIIFMALWRFSKWILGGILFVCSTISVAWSFHASWNYNLTAIISNLHSPENVFDNNYYLLTHTRATPWFIGIALGYYLFKINQRQSEFNMSKKLILVLWSVCFCVLLTCIFCGHGTLRSEQYDRWGNAFHIALVRPFWSAAIAWIVLACTNGYGGPIDWMLSRPIFQVLNKFTYSIYLTHVTFVYAMAYGRKWPDYFSGFNMVYQFWGTLIFSTGLAAILVFTTESPIIMLDKLFTGYFEKFFGIRENRPGGGSERADTGAGEEHPLNENTGTGSSTSNEGPGSSSSNEGTRSSTEPQRSGSSVSVQVTDYTASTQGTKSTASDQKAESSSSEERTGSSSSIQKTESTTSS